MISRLITKAGPSLLSRGPRALWIIGIILFFIIPFVEQRRNVHDESNLRNSFGTSRVAERSELVRTADLPPRIIMSGRRSSGAESFLVINCGNSSLAVTTLASALRNEPYFSMDVHFYFLKTCSDVDAIDIPQGLVRGGLLVDFSHDTPGNICVHTFGRGGLQPNQDLVNTVLSAFVARGLECSFLCGNPGIRLMSVIQPLADLFPPKMGRQWKHFTLYLLSMIKEHTSYGGGGLLRSEKGIYIVGVSSRTQAQRSHVLDSAIAIEYVVRSFNNLNERLHHSCPVWISLSPYEFVDFQLAQAISFVFIGVGMLLIFGSYVTSRKNKEVIGFAHLLFLPIFLFCPFYPVEGGLICAVVMGSFCHAVAFRFILQIWTVVWMVLYLALHPALSIFGNAVLAFQLLCLNSDRFRFISAFLSVGVACCVMATMLPKYSEEIRETGIRSYIFAMSLLATAAVAQSFRSKK